MARPRGVLVFGSVNLDLVLPCAHLPAAGETVAADDPLHLPGGKGGNQAFAAARAGAATRLAASLGDDAAADAALDGLAQAGCDLSLTLRGTRPTGIAVVAIGPRRADTGRAGRAAVNAASGSPAFDNQIIVAAGANADLDDRAVADADLADMVLVTQNETPAPALARLHVRARAAGAVVVHNAAPARGRDAPPLIAVDWLVVNETEWADLSGQTIGDDSAGGGQGGQGEDSALAAVLLAGRDALGLRADQRVVLTLGSRGAAALDGDDVLIQPAPAVTVVDSTGAGDAFVGAFATGLVQDMAATGPALAAGVAAGALACGAVGARSATPDAAAIAVMRAGLPPQRLVRGQPSAR